jgi:hypothetical protein
MSSCHIKPWLQSVCAFLKSNSPRTQSGLHCSAIVQPRITCWTPPGMPKENWLERNILSARPLRFRRSRVLHEKRVKSEPMVIGRSRGSEFRSRSSYDSLWKEIMMIDDRNFQRGLGRMPLTNRSTNFLRRAALEGLLAASRNSSQVHLLR